MTAPAERDFEREAFEDMRAAADAAGALADDPAVQDQHVLDRFKAALAEAGEEEGA